MNKISHQQTFNTVVEHLRKQGKKATTENDGCCYRTPDGLKCAAGILIPDSEYNHEFEGYSVYITPESRTLSLAGEFIEKLGHDIALVSCLQRVHDVYESDRWEEKFKAIADVFGLYYERPQKNEAQLEVSTSSQVS